MTTLCYVEASWHRDYESMTTSPTASTTITTTVERTRRLDLTEDEVRAVLIDWAKRVHGFTNAVELGYLAEHTVSAEFTESHTTESVEDGEPDA